MSNFLYTVHLTFHPAKSNSDHSKNSTSSSSTASSLSNGSARMVSYGSPKKVSPESAKRRSSNDGRSSATGTSDGSSGTQKPTRKRRKVACMRTMMKAPRQILPRGGADSSSTDSCDSAWIDKHDPGHRRRHVAETQQGKGRCMYRRDGVKCNKTTINFCGLCKQYFCHFGRTDRDCFARHVDWCKQRGAMYNWAMLKHFGDLECQETSEG